jgi:hypothetical protein
MMRSLASRRGATLPMVILLITVMTIALAAAYTLNGTEIQVGDDYEEQVAALALAESGRHRYLTDRAALGFQTDSAPPALESDTIAYVDGRAIVTLTRIRPQVQQLPALYLLTSRGIRSVATKPGVPPAERTVAQYVFWDAAPLNVLAGWTSLSGLQKNGLNPNSISGIDQNPGGVAGCPPTMNQIAAVAVPTVPGFSGNIGSLAGTPQVQPLGDAASTRDAVDIDWAGIVNGTADITYNIIIPAGVLPTTAFFTANPNYWPTIKVTGNLALTSNGRGTLIVTGDVVMSNNARWDGVILVGGTLTSNGLTGVSGAVVTGLNVKLGMVVPVTDVGNGDKAYRFNSCNASKALKQQAKLRPLPNTWMDNWASY